jgi:hypothetical protein
MKKKTYDKVFSEEHQLFFKERTIQEQKYIGLTEDEEHDIFEKLNKQIPLTN